MRSLRIGLIPVFVLVHSALTEADQPQVLVAEPGPFSRLYEAGAGSFEVDAIYGGDIEDEDSFLYAPVDMTLDASGNLYILDAKLKQIKKFDPQANHLLTFSRPGEGPGDLDRPAAIDILPDGRVLVFDGSLRRFTTFSPQGEYLKSWEFNEMGSHRIWRMRVDPFGTIYADFNHQGPGRKPEDPIPFRLSKLTLDPYTETVIDSADIALTRIVRVGDNTIYTSKPATPYYSWCVFAGDLLAAGNSATGEVRVYDRELHLRHAIQVATPRPPFTQSDRDAYRKRHSSGPNAIHILKGIDFPEYHNYWQRMHADDEAFLLLQVGLANEERAEYEIRDLEGGHVGNITLPYLRKSSLLHNGQFYTFIRHDGQDLAVYRYSIVED